MSLHPPLNPASRETRGSSPPELLRLERFAQNGTLRAIARGSVASIVLTLLVLVGTTIAEGSDDEAAANQASTTVTLKWTARSETSVYGYLIYRAERRQGPFLRINTEIIRLTGPADEATTNSYVYKDTTVQPGATYFYYLDTISNDGRKDRFSGVIKKAAPPDSTPKPDAE